MAKRAVIIKVRVDIENPNVNEITNEDVANIIDEMDYNFEPVGDFQLETEIREVSNINME
ncbi:MAG: hypothetical protein LBM08_00720 [Dysgonamonadaceae bacterium]|nr:hypothetical protein [Dysgonamonadaceae bacterium]